MGFETVEKGFGKGIGDLSSDFAKANTRGLVSFDSKNQSETEYCQDWFVEPQKRNRLAEDQKEILLQANY
tara:strand:- start:7097 stop:7306 length:210 start_codon:yes stop_codon:yes gene_type:complete